MSLTKQVFTAANTETFAEALKTALENTGLFDTVTRSTLVVTCTKDSQEILKVDTGTWNHVLIFKNANGTTLNDVTLDQSTSTLASYASISTDGKFVHCILTNTYSSTGNDATRSLTFCVCGTKNGNVCMAHTKTYGRSDTLYPPNWCWISSSSALATDPTADVSGGGTAFFIPRSFAWTSVVSYPLTTIMADGDVDIADGVYGIICAPTMFTLARSQAGVTPATVEIDGKQYLTDGVLLIDIDESAGA